MTFPLASTLQSVRLHIKSNTSPISPSFIMSHHQHKSPHLWDMIIGGALSGIFSVTMTYPFGTKQWEKFFHAPNFDFDPLGLRLTLTSSTPIFSIELLKTRLHFELGLIRSETSNIRTMVKQVWKEGYSRPIINSPLLGGILAFYRGLGQLVPEAAIKALLRFLAFHEIHAFYSRYILGTSEVHMTFGSNLICGSIAGALEAILVVQPFERGKILRTDFQSPYRIYFKAFKDGGVIGGFKTIYTGFLPCLLRQIFNQAAGLSIIYGLKGFWLTSTQKRELTSLERFSFGFVGGVGGAILTMPIDVTKSIAQKQNGPNIKSMTEIVKDVFKTNGVRGFYTGLIPRLGRVGLDRAFGFLMFDYIVEHMPKWRKSFANR